MKHQNSTGQRGVHSNGLPPAQGLYDPANERDACGIGFVVNIQGQKSHDIVRKGIQVLINLTHRGACGCGARTRQCPDPIPDTIGYESVSWNRRLVRAEQRAGREHLEQ